MMDKTQNPWFVDSDNGDYTVARVFPNGSNYKSVEKKHKDDIVYTDQGSQPTTFPSTLTVRPMKSQRRLLMLKRFQLRKQS